MLQDKIEDLQSKLTAVQEQRTQLRSRSHMLATALQLRKEELRKLRERQAQVLSQHLVNSDRNWDMSALLRTPL